MKRMAYTKPNILALLENRKFNSRRIINPQPTVFDRTGQPDFICLKPKYKVGDEIGVAEGYQIVGYSILFSGHTKVYGKYLCDDAHFSTELTLHERELWIARKYPYRPAPARFMYNSLIRIKYTLTGVGVERLQDISGEDCLAEGIDNGKIKPFPKRKHTIWLENYWIIKKECIDRFKVLWNSVHGGEAWERNDWVFIYKWKEIRIEQ